MGCIARHLETVCLSDFTGLAPFEEDSSTKAAFERSSGVSVTRTRNTQP